MFLTLSEFECLFGVIPEDDLKKLLKIGPFNRLKNKEAPSIRPMVVELLALSQKEREEWINEAMQSVAGVFPERKAMLERLQQQFPNDEGILVSCFLRYKVIPPGRCFAIGAGVPHAYLKGTCFEIMKNSDNVVRLGLTPKLKDVETMLAIMNDQIGLDGFEVPKSPLGFVWNNLRLHPTEVGEEGKLMVASQSIGVVLSGHLKCASSDFSV